MTTDFSLVSLAFVGQFLLDERLQVSKESGEVWHLEYNRTIIISLSTCLSRQGLLLQDSNPYQYMV